MLRHPVWPSSSQKNFCYERVRSLLCRMLQNWDIAVGKGLRLEQLKGEKQLYFI